MNFFSLMAASPLLFFLGPFLSGVGGPLLFTAWSIVVVGIFFFFNMEGGTDSGSTAFSTWFQTIILPAKFIYTNWHYYHSFLPLIK